MNVLIHGGESLKRVESLLKLVTFKASAKSDDMKEAIKSYLVGGMSQSATFTMHNVDRNNFLRKLAEVNEAAKIVESIKEDDWDEYSAFVQSRKVTTLKRVS